MLKIERVEISQLIPDPSNVRLHDDINLDAIRGSLSRFGQQKPIVVGQGNIIIAGNATFVAAKSLGWSQIDIVRTELTGVEATSYAIADNRTAELATWDGNALAKILQELQSNNTLEGIGYSPTDIDVLLNELDQDLDSSSGVDPDQVPEPPEKAVTLPGDIWILGRHRLMCGDSSKPEDVDRLLAGAPVHLVNTDPPYNVRVEPRSNNAIAAGLSSFSAQHHQQMDVARHPEKSQPTTRSLRARDRPLQNDFMRDEEFSKMLYAWFGNITRVLLPGRGFYIWGGYANCANYPPVLKDCGLYFSQAVIWIKEHPVLTRKDFMGNHEWCFYGWKEGAAHQWFGPNNATDTWSIKKVNPQSMVHLTEKPVELATRAMGYSSQANENVLDLFGGSGSTLIGAEQVRRNAFLMEIDALYCDVIVDRWQTFTGKEARLEDGKTFSQVKTDRNAQEVQA